MKLTARVELQSTPPQAAALLDTLQHANAAANFTGQIAWDSTTSAQFKLHQPVYAPARAQFVLSIQLVVRLIAKVAIEHLQRCSVTWAAASPAMLAV
jgi:hypothetical protein